MHLIFIIYSFLLTILSGGCNPPSTSTKLPVPTQPSAEETGTLNTDIITATSHPQKLAVGVMHACVISASDGKASCWGEEQDGNVNNPSKKELKSIVAGDRYNIGITNDNKLEGWGHNPPIMPQGVPSYAVKDVAINAQGTCMIKENNQLDCIGGGWANNGLYRLTGKEAVATSVGFDQACYLDIEQHAHCMSTHPAKDQKLTTDLPIQKLIQLAVSGSFACGLSETSEVMCWGEDPPNPPQGLKAKYIVVGANFSCVIKLDNTLACFGNNNKVGQLDAPKEKALYLGANGFHACIIKESDKKPLCWGSYSFDGSRPLQQAPADLMVQ